MEQHPLRIGYDAKRLFTNFTGLGNYSRTLLTHLAEFYPQNEYLLFTPEIKENARTAPFLQNPRFHPVFPSNKTPLWRTSMIPRLADFKQLDLFHGLSHELPVGIASSGMPSVVTMHDLIFKYFPEDYPWFDRLSYELKFRSAANRADRIIAISHQTKRDLIKYYSIQEEKIEVIYQTCSPAFKQKRDKEEILEIKKKFKLPTDYFLYVGSIIARKNLLNLIRAIELLPADYQMPLVVIGDGKKYRERILQYLSGSPLKEKVIFRSDIPFHFFPPVYQGARLMAYPSLHEGFGLPVLEAIASGIPVITSNQSSLTEVGGQVAMYCEPSSPESIAHALQNVLEEDGYVQSRKELYTSHLESFEPARVSHQLMSLYQELTTRKNS